MSEQGKRLKDIATEVLDAARSAIGEDLPASQIPGLPILRAAVPRIAELEAQVGELRGLIREAMHARTGCPWCLGEERVGELDRHHAEDCPACRAVQGEQREDTP